MIVDGNTKTMDSANIFGETEGEESMENLTPDYVYPPADPFEWAVHPWSGPIPSTVVLKTNIKYDNSLLQHFGYSHKKTKDWINRVVQLTKPMMSHNSLSIKVALEMREVTHIDETLKANNYTIYYLQQTKRHNSLTSYFCKDNGRDSTRGIAFNGAACSRLSAISINELLYSDHHTAKVFAHELGHIIGMQHDFEDFHGGHHGKCNHKASNCGGCPQGHGARWCNGDCRWWHGQCVARSGTGWGHW